MFKKILLTLGLVLMISEASYAYTIDATSNNSTIYGVGRLDGVTYTTFGKFIIGDDDYGLFVHVKYKPGYDNKVAKDVLYFKLDSGYLVREDDTMFLINGGEKIKVAEKKFLRWKKASNVKIGTDAVFKDGEAHIKAWLIIED